MCIGIAVGNAPQMLVRVAQGVLAHLAILALQDLPNGMDTIEGCSEDYNSLSQVKIWTKPLNDRPFS